MYVQIKTFMDKYTLYFQGLDMLKRCCVLRGFNQSKHIKLELILLLKHCLHTIIMSTKLKIILNNISNNYAL